MNFLVVGQEILLTLQSLWKQDLLKGASFSQALHYLESICLDLLCRVTNQVSGSTCWLKWLWITWIHALLSPAPAEGTVAACVSHSVCPSPAKSIMGLRGGLAAAAVTKTVPTTKVRRGRKKLYKATVSSPLLNSPDTDTVRPEWFTVARGDVSEMHLAGRQCKACCLCFRFLQCQRRKRRAITSS